MYCDKKVMLFGHTFTPCKRKMYKQIYLRMMAKKLKSKARRTKLQEGKRNDERKQMETVGNRKT